MYSFRFRVSRVQGLGFGVSGLGFIGFSHLVSGLRVQAYRLRV